MDFFVKKNKPSAASSTAVAQPEAQPRDAVAEAEQKLAALKQSFGGVATRLGRIEQETKVVTEALKTARGMSETEIAKLRRSRGVDADPTQRLTEANAEISKRKEEKTSLETELGSLKPILAPQIVSTRKALAKADEVDKNKFYEHLGKAFEVLKKIDVRASEFKRLTTRYAALAANYGFFSLDDAVYPNSARPPQTGAAQWHAQLIQWRLTHPSLEDAPARRWLDGVGSLVEKMKKL